MPDDLRPSLMSAVFYKDPRAALAWLERAFGFETFMLIEGAEGSVEHAEMSYGTGVLMVGGEWSDDHKSPASIAGKNTQTIHIQIKTDINAHFERAKAAGGEMLMAPTMQFYGDATYRCRDPEGHIWTVSQNVKTVTREEAEAASGLKITGWV